MSARRDTRRDPWTGSAQLSAATPHGAALLSAEGVPMRQSMLCFPTPSERDAFAQQMGWTPGKWVKLELA